MINNSNVHKNHIEYIRVLSLKNCTKCKIFVIYYGISKVHFSSGKNIDELVFDNLVKHNTQTVHFYYGYHDSVITMT
ncbi:hypothetical protein SJAG_05840 [Schizosaccharomyces japonicus yFS275]|uniref:Uncharacterized protein n=1 Tax=Schizosaccharomyces japonicus (strain yFS275 / FY16936) TaxID=402676 RepID=T0T6E0_SCHJY|nr:hypothetical protein SJAG_05840 [Schizosaccharomyces japonicus yFS275]EQC52999.1 hypothetical protein SJAG_05840 [Schizosaccharomyces japonicus yFS275]